MSGMNTCICCEKEIFDEQDYTTLICHAAGQTISHTTLAHDKCWDKFKKSFVRGRGTSSRTQTFFCPVNGCHNALQHQHMSVRKKTHGGSSAGPTAPKKVDGLASGSGDVPDSYTALPGLDGAPRLPAKQGEGQPQLSWPSATLSRPALCLARLALRRSAAAPQLCAACAAAAHMSSPVAIVTLPVHSRKCRACRQRGGRRARGALPPSPLPAWSGTPTGCPRSLPARCLTAPLPPPHAGGSRQPVHRAQGRRDTLWPTGDRCQALCM